MTQSTLFKEHLLRNGWYPADAFRPQRSKYPDPYAEYTFDVIVKFWDHNTDTFRYLPYYNMKYDIQGRWKFPEYAEDMYDVSPNKGKVIAFRIHPDWNEIVKDLSAKNPEPEPAE